MKRPGCIILFFLIVMFFSFDAYADKEPSSLIAESKYFSLYGYNGLDTDSLLIKLQMDYFLHPDTLFSQDILGEQSVLEETMDAIFLEVSDILDIHIYSFHGDVQILPNKGSLNSIYRTYFDTDFNERSFYLSNTNTIYISFEDMTLGMLGHEISHAIISRYFVVPPPSKLQEVLCGYVEYKIRKPIDKIGQ
ncbi:MAG: hypothetical protein ABIG92_05280 [Candidatus Omnitrophota bacterium]